MSHYDVLGTSPDADAETLRRAFVSMARRFHPDQHIGADPAVRREVERRMREITEAWAVLGDPKRRARYDLGLGDRIGARAGNVRPGAGSESGSRQPSAGGSASTSGRDWRAYASPGAGATSRRSSWEQLALLSPVLLLFTAGLFGMGGAIIGWPPFFAMALVCVIGAAAAFFMLPIWAMTRGSAKWAGRGPKRSY